MQHKQTVLVIDDSPTVVRLAELILSEEGYDVLTAEDGDDGLRIARENMPSLIIVDFIMPKMNGFQFCKNIRSDPNLRDVPIVLITSKGKDVGQGFDDKFGIVQYLQKPFEAETLVETVKASIVNVEEEHGETATAEETTPQNIPHEEQITAQTPVTDISSVNDPGMESDPVDTSYSEPNNPEDNEKENDTATYIAIQDNIAKEFRHYFGQELMLLLKSAIIQSLKETDLVKSSRRVLSGEIMYISVADVLSIAGTSGISGKLSILTNNFNSDIYLKSGQIVFAAISQPGCTTSLEQLILKDDKSLKKEIISVLTEANGDNLTAGSLLLQRGLISEHELIEYFRRLSEDAIDKAVSATSGHFYIEDVPLPMVIRNINLSITVDGSKYIKLRN